MWFKNRIVPWSLNQVNKGPFMNIKESTIFLTGASGGIGKELALLCSKSAAKIAPFARREELLKELADEITGNYPVDVFVDPWDVSSKDSVDLAFSEAVRECGVPDILIANAGIGKNFSVKKFNSHVIEEIYKTNVFGMMYCIEAVLPHMIKKRRGHIVGISSLAAYRSFPRNHSYCASKSAVSAHLEGLRSELYSYGIQVSTICPGFIKTPMTENNRFSMPFLMEAQEAAQKIVGAIERDKKVFNFPWQTWMMAKMARMLPDHLITKMS